MLLLFVAFASGAILMALELVGSRVLAPHFGGSIFVWGSLIGVFLAALSIGYYVGGRAADFSPRVESLALFLLAAGVFVLLLPRYGSGICDRIALRDFGARANPLIACVLLFFIPGMLMAVTSPFVIRLTARSLSRVGRTAGAVYAVSTIGSIAGTLGAAFYLIPAMGTTAILYLLGALLLAAGLLAVSLRRPRRGTAAAIALLALGVLAQPACAEEKTLLTRDSAYHRLFVTEEGHYRWLRADNICHTQMDLRDPHGRGLPYSDYVDLAFLFKPDIRSVLVIGLGGGTVPKRFVRGYPQVTVDAVEIDPDVVTIAKRYFHVEPGPRLRIHQADGRMFLRRTDDTWDMILLDAYYADTVPFFLCTKEFFEIAKARLSPGGVLVNNVVGQVSGARSKFFRSVYHTMDEVFPHVYGFEVAESGTTWVNIEVFGLNSDDRISLEEIRLRAQRMQGKIIHDPKLLQRVRDHVEGPIPEAGAKILTDDYAPVDALIHLW